MDHPNNIPMSVEAETRNDLLKKCLEINIRSGTYHNFFDFQKDGKKWVCFFYDNISRANLLNRIMNNE